MSSNSHPPIDFGSLRHTPLVKVLRPLRPAELRGMEGSFYSHRLEAAEAAIRDYRAGGVVTVRVVNGLPYADQNDWFRLAGAFWITLFAGILLVTGATIAMAGRIRQAPQWR